ncbi:hypothetical protein Leryth_026398 [Lithospermum erythrorhizon]|nr:hypothetical protein Leryth_026398 [Lithospermum erythrorhizon]
MSCDGVGGIMYPSPPLPQQPTMQRPCQWPCFSRSPPAFLTKTYTMVDDPNTNHIISWSLSGTSLIVWNHIKLAEEILPKHFKHNNFSSFLYQLNNYGFSKIGLEQWEYEHQWFQRGRKQLLLNIKRRDKPTRIIKRRYSRKLWMDVANNEINNTQLENLRNHIAAYKEEFQKLKEQQALVQDKITLFKEQIRVTKGNSMKIITFLAKAYGDTIDKDGTQEIGEDIVCKEHGEVAEKGLTSDADHSFKNDQLDETMEANDVITEANAAKSYQNNSFRRNFLEIDTQGENESEPDFVMLNMGIDDMTESNIAFIPENESKPNKIDVGEGTLHLWT